MLSSVFIKSLYTYPQALLCISRAKVTLVLSICLSTGTIVDKLYFGRNYISHNTCDSAQT